MSVMKRISRNTKRDVRVRIARLIVMERIAIQDHGGTLGNIHPIVHEILGGTVGRSVPERGVNT